MTYASMYPTLRTLIDEVTEPGIKELLIKAYYAGLADGIHVFAVHQNGTLEVGVRKTAWPIVKKELLDECQDALRSYAR